MSTLDDIARSDSWPDNWPISAVDWAEHSGTRITELERQRDTLRVALVQAREDLEDWAAYAPAYMRDKWGLADDFAAIDKALEASK